MNPERWPWEWELLKPPTPQNKPSQTMNLLMGHGPDAMRIAAALGLPKFTRRFTLVMEPGEPAIVTVEKYIEGDTATVEGLTSVFERYRLVRIEDDPGDEGQANEEAP
jgi:endonuclease YncB( thermonuclease family)